MKTQSPWRLVVNSILSSRYRLAGALGQSFNGERDLYETLGYKRTLDFDDYYGDYERTIIGKRLINKPPSSTWQKQPIIKDGNEASTDESPRSAFLQAWKALANRLKIFQYLERADRLARIGYYGVLVIGAKDGKGLDSEITDKLSGPEALLYLLPRSEGRAMIAEYDRDSQSPRYGLPLYYNIIVGELSGTGTKRVHYSRVLHIAESKDDDEVYGTPALQAAYNRLDDLEKVIGGNSEAFWLLVRKGMAILADDDTDFSQAEESFQQEVDDYKHGLDRIMQLAGIKDIKEFGSDTPDPTGIFNTLISLLAADADMPQAVLVGTTKNGLGGEASGETDQKLWAATIEARQKNYAEPEILRPFIDWCLKYGVLPQPDAVAYTVKWEPLYNPTEKEQAEVAKANAEAIRLLAKAREAGSDEIMPPEVFSERWLDFVPEVEAGAVEMVEEERLAALVANHKGVTVQMTCPFCGHSPVEHFKEDGGLCRCSRCEMSYDPVYHYGVVINGKA